MSRIVAQVARLREGGAAVALVSSGAQAAGRHALAGHSADAQPSRQVFASVGQHRLMQTWGTLFDAYDLLCAQVLLTRRDLADRQTYLNARNTLRELLQLGVVPVINENDAVALDRVLATRIGENDSLSAYVANLIDADLLVLLTDVDGLYDADPNTNPDARLIPRVERIDASLEAVAGGTRGVGTGGMTTKLKAAAVATLGGTDVVIVNGREPGILLALASGEARGTLFPAAADRRESRKRWIVGSINRGGHIIVDEGAARALRERGRSLLPAGVAGVAGAFERGEAVEVRDAAGQTVAAGQVNYASHELERIRGLHSARIASVLGYDFGDEVIHRDNMVLL